MSTFTLLCTFLSYMFLYPLMHPLDESAQYRAFAGITIDTSMGATTVDTGRPYVFAKAGDGKLWVNWWDGSAWHWANQGTPPGVKIAGSMGAITVDTGRPYVFIQG